jgi:hypothetical protein
MSFTQITCIVGMSLIFYIVELNNISSILYELFGVCLLLYFHVFFIPRHTTFIYIKLYNGTDLIFNKALIDCICVFILLYVLFFIILH